MVSDALLAPRLAAVSASQCEFATTPVIVRAHVPRTPETYHSISAPELALMKPTSVIIKAARGNVIEEETLAEVLRSRGIAGAGLDVFEHEPQVRPALIALSTWCSCCMSEQQPPRHGSGWRFVPSIILLAALAAGIRPTCSIRKGSDNNRDCTLALARVAQRYSWLRGVRSFFQR